MVVSSVKEGKPVLRKKGAFLVIIIKPKY